VFHDYCFYQSLWPICKFGINFPVLGVLMGFVSAATRDGPHPYTYRDVPTTLHSNSSRNHSPPASIPWQAFKNSLDCTLLPPPISQALPSSSSPRQGKDVCEACAGTTQFCAWMCFIVWWLLLLLETVIDYPCSNSCRFEFSVFWIFAGIKTTTSGLTGPRSDQLS